MKQEYPSQGWKSKQYVQMGRQKYQYEDSKESHNLQVFLHWQ